jgi:hypothetical protein
LELKTVPPNKITKGKTAYNKDPARAARACFALRVRKWPVKAARPFALTFGLAQKQIAPYGRNLFACPQVVTHGMLRA